jgi:leader peptidase (prepilin peptidase)/N-methyltransferase
MTLAWLVASFAAALVTGARIRGSVFSRSVEPGEPPRDACPACAREVGSAGHRWYSLLPMTGRCPACRVRIGPPALSVELATALALAVVATRASSPWELAGLAWLVLFAIPLVFIDIAVHRLPDALTGAAFAGTLGFLTVAALTGGHPGQLARAGIAAVALCAFYLLLFIIRPSGMGFGDVKLAASVGLGLGWIGWQAVVAGTFLTFIIAAVYGVALLLLHRATRSSQLPFGPFIVLGTLLAIVV